MKKISSIMLIVFIFLFIRCSNKQIQVDSNEKSEVTSEERINENHLEESDSHKITEMYSNLDKDKDKLKYEIVDKDYYFLKLITDLLERGLWIVYRMWIVYPI